MIYEYRWFDVFFKLIMKPRKYILKYEQRLNVTVAIASACKCISMNCSNPYECHQFPYLMCMLRDKKSINNDTSIQHITKSTDVL